MTLYCLSEAAAVPVFSRIRLFFCCLNVSSFGFTAELRTPESLYICSVSFLEGGAQHMCAASHHHVDHRNTE